jgi:hypothetical protein
MVLGSAENGSLLLLDGVTGSGLDCVHGVRWFVRVLAAEISRRLAELEPHSLTLCVQEAVLAVRGLHPECGGVHPLSYPQSTLVAASWNNFHLDVLALGDSVISIYDEAGRLLLHLHDRLADRIADAQRASLVSLAGAPGDHQVNLRSWTSGARNSDGGFFTVADDPGVVAYALEEHMDLANGFSVFAGSDGIFDLGLISESGGRLQFEEIDIWRRVMIACALPSRTAGRFDDISIAFSRWNEAEGETPSLSR